MIILFIRNNIQYGLQKWCKPNAIELARIAEVQPTSAIRCKITENLADQRRIYLKILFEFDNDIAVDPKHPFGATATSPRLYSLYLCGQSMPVVWLYPKDMYIRKAMQKFMELI
ncbi:hypothetical protein [Prevotella sp. ne3005]|uniref:hypothetical protein n=1 Tax=Prevotella sp. ne3005 TaxID=1761887 RepID=UPI0011136075|nr:hypothetical protein [Prevotella sp. ne3005]